MRTLQLALLVCLSITGLVSAGGIDFALGDDKKMIHKWAKLKALESCLGEDVTKTIMLKMKRAYAKCLKVDMPEIELPMYA